MLVLSVALWCGSQALVAITPEREGGTEGGREGGREVGREKERGEGGAGREEKERDRGAVYSMEFTLESLASIQRWLDNEPGIYHGV